MRTAILHALVLILGLVSWHPAEALADSVNYSFDLFFVGDCGGGVVGLCHPAGFPGITVGSLITGTLSYTTGTIAGSVATLNVKIGSDTYSGLGFAAVFKAGVLAEFPYFQASGGLTSAASGQTIPVYIFIPNIPPPPECQGFICDPPEIIPGRATSFFEVTTRPNPEGIVLTDDESPFLIANGGIWQRLPSPVPEVATWITTGTGLLGLIALRKLLG